MLINNEIARDYYYNIIKPLVEHDKDSNDDLITSLKEYAINQCNVTKAAKELYIHRNTLTYRLNKIEDILNCNLDNYDIQLSLQLALKTLESDNLQ